jgi:hypothetical protein
MGEVAPHHPWGVNLREGAGKARTLHPYKKVEEVAGFLLLSHSISDSLPVLPPTTHDLGHRSITEPPSVPTGRL